MSTLPYDPARLANRADEIVAATRELSALGWTPATSSNFSMRLDERHAAITVSGRDKGRLVATDIMVVDMAGKAVATEHRPSAETLLHTQLYARYPDVGCVLHTHSTHLVALTLQGVWRTTDILPPLTPYQLMKVGHVPLVPYRVPGDAAVADDVAALITHAPHPLRAVMLERLGPTVWHDSPGNAMALLEELEETARLWLMSERRAEPLTDAQIDVLRTRFNAPW